MRRRGLFTHDWQAGRDEWSSVLILIGQAQEWVGFVAKNYKKMMQLELKSFYFHLYIIAFLFYALKSLCYKFLI